MEQNLKAQVHLQRKGSPVYEDGRSIQRLTYDLAHQTPESIVEFKNVMKHFSARSRGEFQYWFTGDVNFSYEDEECETIKNEYEERFNNEGHKKNIHTLHSGESETNEK